MKLKAVVLTKVGNVVVEDCNFQTTREAWNRGLIIDDAWAVLPSFGFI